MASRRGLNKRQFLKLAAGTAGISVVAACSQAAPAAPTSAPSNAAPAATTAPTPPAAPPTVAPTATIAPVPTVAPTTAATPATAATIPAQPKSANALPDDAAPSEQQVFRIMTPEDRYLCTGIGGYNVIWNVCASMFDNLVSYTNDWGYEKGQANTWDVSPDGLTYTYHLKPGQTWSDGQPITADDYVNHFKVIEDPKNATDVAWYWYPIVNAQEINQSKKDLSELGVKALDSNTLQMVLKQPTSYWNYLMAYQDSHAYAKHAWDKYADKMYTSLESSPLSGYWKMTDWTKGKGIIVQARTDYQGNHPGLLQRVEFPFGAATTQFAAYQNNEIDIVDSITAPGDIAAIQSDAQLSKEHYVWPQWTDWYLLFHTQDGPFKDARVRQAVSHAVDRDAICKGPLKNLGQPSYTIIPPGFPGNQADSAEVQQIQQYNPDMARKLLADAGFAGGKNIPPMDMWIRGTGDAVTVQVSAAEAIQAMLKDTLGITVKIRPEDAKIYMDNLGKYKIGITLLSWGFDFTDPIDMLGIPFRSKYPQTGGRLDWKNDAFDKLIDSAAVSNDMNARYKMFQDAEKILLQDAGAVPVWNPISHQLWKPYVKGLTKNSSGITQYVLFRDDLTRIYIAKH